MITRDPGQIEIAVEQVIDKDAYIPVSKEVFVATCPNPSLAIHISARDADEAATRIEEAWEKAGNPIRAASSS